MTGAPPPRATPSAASGERFDNVDLLRAFAATAVVVYHVIEYAKWTDFPISGPLVTFRIGWIGVDLFFVISGFVITRSALGLWRADPSAFQSRYWVRRLTRIVPLYVLTCALWVVLYKRGLWDEPVTHWLWHLGVASHVHAHVLADHLQLDRRRQLDARDRDAVLPADRRPRAVDRADARAGGSGSRASRSRSAWRGTMVHFFGHYEPVRLFTRVMQLPGALDEFGAGIFLAKLLDDRSAPRLRDGALWIVAAIASGGVCFGIYWTYSYWDVPAMVIVLAHVARRLLPVRRRGGGLPARTSHGHGRCAPSAIWAR